MTHAASAQPVSVSFKFERRRPWSLGLIELRHAISGVAPGAASVTTSADAAGLSAISAPAAGRNSGSARAKKFGGARGSASYAPRASLMSRQRRWWTAVNTSNSGGLDNHRIRPSSACAGTPASVRGHRCKADRHQLTFMPAAVSVGKVYASVGEVAARRLFVPGARSLSGAVVCGCPGNRRVSVTLDPAHGNAGTLTSQNRGPA